MYRIYEVTCIECEVTCPGNRCKFAFWALEISSRLTGIECEVKGIEYEVTDIECEVTGIEYMK
jgi:hypothetical protein